MMELSDCSSCRDGQCSCGPDEPVESLSNEAIAVPSAELDELKSWRADFEKEIKSRGYDLVRLPDGKYADYIDTPIEQFWQWFLAGRQTACIDFPCGVSSNEKKQEYGSDFCNGYDTSVIVCRSLILKQGYKCRQKDCV